MCSVCKDPHEREYFTDLLACSYEEYVPVKKRRQLEAQKRLAILGKVHHHTFTARIILRT